MKEKNFREVETLRGYYEKRGRRFDSPKKYKRYYFIFFVLGVISFVVFTGVFFYKIKTNGYSNPKIDIPFVTLINLASLSVYFLMLIYSQDVPENRIRRNKWFYKNGLIARVLKTFISFIFTFISYYALNHYNLNKGFGNLILFTGFFGVFIYNFSILYLIIFPKHLLSGFITGLGTGSRILGFGFIIIGIRSILIYYFIESILLDLLILIVLGFLARLVVEIDYRFLKYSEFGLNFVQMRVLDVVKPLQLSLVFRSYIEELKDKKQAIKLLKKLEKKEQYGVMIELANMLSKERTSKSKWVIGILAAFLLFILTSIGEGIIQDLFNDSVKEAFCNLLGILC